MADFVQRRWHGAGKTTSTWPFGTSWGPITDQTLILFAWRVAL
jgi:hypothetical protein